MRTKKIVYVQRVEVGRRRVAAVGLRRRTRAQRVSAYLEQLCYEGVHPPIDAVYVWYRRANPDVVTEFAVPPLGEQRSSRSDIADLKWFDRSPLTRGGANALRRLRRMVAMPHN